MSSMYCQVIRNGESPVSHHIITIFTFELFLCQIPSTPSLWDKCCLFSSYWWQFWLGLEHHYRICFIQEKEDHRNVSNSEVSFLYSDSVWITNISSFSIALELLSNLGIPHSCVYVITTDHSVHFVRGCSHRHHLASSSELTSPMNSCQISFWAW